MFYRFRFIVTPALRIFHQTKDIICLVYTDIETRNKNKAGLRCKAVTDREWCFVVSINKCAVQNIAVLYIDLNNINYSIMVIGCLIKKDQYTCKRKENLMNDYYILNATAVLYVNFMSNFPLLDRVLLSFKISPKEFYRFGR